MTGIQEQDACETTPSGVGVADGRTGIDRELDGLRPQLDGVLRSIGERPELGYQEHHAVAELVGLLAAYGHKAEVGLAGMDTAFRARVDSGTAGPCVAFLAEYDALPGFGHACGHNVIATVAVGAFLALARVLPRGAVELIGCPAEESAVDGAGGKVRLLAAGVFDGVDAALMAHPYDRDMVVTRGNLAARGVDLQFRGRPAHAVADPGAGINALEAAVDAFVAIQRLGDQLPPDHYMNAIIPEGGESANMIPSWARIRYRLRAPTVPEVDALRDRVVTAARDVATTAGCEFTVREFAPLYAEMRPDRELVAVAREVMDACGYTVEPDGGSISVGSTDFGNVSQTTRALEIGVQLAPRGTGLHTPDFAAAAIGPGATDVAVGGARILALTALRGVLAA